MTNDGIAYVKLSPVRLKATPRAKTVHGWWVRLDAQKGMEQFKCSICRSECYVPTCMGKPMYAYCPNCGTKMDLEELPWKD